MTQTDVPCSNCELPLGDEARYCSRCGQRVLRPQDRRFTALLGSVFEELTSINGRFLPTFGRLLGRPGSLSLAWQRGQWQRYLKPINVFLLANLVFFLAPSLSDFSVTLLDQKTLQPYSAWAAPWIDARVAASGLSFAEFADAYQQRSNDVAKTLVILHVPLIALITLVMFVDRRLPYADHVVTALHLFAFLMLYYALLPYTIEPLMDGVDALLPMALPTLPIALTLQFIYLPFMMRTAFGVGWLRAIASTVVFLPLLLVVHLAYRGIQLVVVLTLMR